LESGEQALDALHSFRIDDADLIDHRHEMLGAFREVCPVGRSEEHGGYYLITGFSQVREAFLNVDAFSSRFVGLDWDLGETEPLIPIQIDRPEHLRYRRILNPFFTRRRTRRFEPEVRRVVRDLLDRFAGDGACDYVGDFAQPLPSHAFVHFVNWPAADADFFHETAYKAIYGHDRRDPRPPPGQYLHGSPEVQRAAGAAIADYFENLVRNHRGDSDDDLIAYLQHARYSEDEGGRLLAEHEIVQILYLLVIAGFDTTRKMLSLVVNFLAHHPVHRDRIAADLSIVPTAVEELMRWETPLQLTRTLTQDYVLGGMQLRKGDKVMLSTTAASRDPACVHAPDEVQLDRKSNPHMTFGAGPHRCLGIHFATMEIQIAVEELHRRLPDFHLAPGKKPEISVGTGVGVDYLPLEFTPAR
jgi:cytochrome P450